MDNREIVLSVDKKNRKLLILYNAFKDCPSFGERGHEDSLFIDVNYWDEVELCIDEYELEEENDDGEDETYYEDYYLLKITPNFTGVVDIDDDINLNYLIYSIKNCYDEHVKYVEDYRRVELCSTNF